ncbi:MAG: hypothetical protein MJZ63_02660 [Muribaculaceae bacterium]|nr:hypothetical protein [Muribaculaceae bacterium]
MKRISFLFIAITAFALNALAGTGGGADLWYFSNLKLDCYPTGAGKVYADGKETEASKEAYLQDAPSTFSISTHKSKLPYKWYINTAPSDTKKYKFVKWIDSNGKDVSTNAITQVSDKNGVLAGGTNTGTSGESYTNPGTITLSYTAIFEEIVLQNVSVQSTDINLGSATIDKLENAIGDEVTIYAYPVVYTAKFDGWMKDGQIVSREPSITFTITAENKGEYTAVFSKGYDFFRIVNKETDRRITAIKDQGSLTDYSALSLTDKETAQSKAGSIWEISNYKLTGRTEFVYTYQAQNFSSEKFYNTENGVGVFMASDHNVYDNTWVIYPNGQPYYMADKGNESVDQSPKLPVEYIKWYYEPMDKDLTTKENYFTFSPDKLLLDESTGKYYTTLRTAWNVLYDTNEITAYIVTGVDEDGILIKTPVTGNIIPKNTCVLIECNSNDTQRNVMVPTNQATSFTATGNILVSAENGKYFPNQPESRSNCKALVLNDGVVGFGGEACTKTNGNDAYLLIDDEANVSDGVKSTTLEEVVDKQTVDKKYKITDLTCVYTFMKDGKAMFFCKDDNGYEDKDEISNGQIDFLKEKTQLMNENNRTDHDQSNWIILEAPASMQITNGEMNNLLSQRLAGVEGKIVDVVNPKLSLSKVPQPYEMNGYTLNTFIPSNFYGYSADDKYYFVTPKPNEMASIHWAMYNGDNHFSAPTNVGTSNPEGLEGEFEVDFSLFNEEMPELIENNVYSFNGLVTKLVPNSSAAKRAQGVVANYYLVYPISNFKWEGSVVDGIVTGINDVNAGRKVMSVKYINVTGNQSSKPFDGINIMVTTYSDGTVGSRKFVK